MRIAQVFVTSKGMFWNRAEAEKRINRAKDYGNRPGDRVELEPVREAFVLVDGDLVFSLTKAEVK